MAAPKFVPTDPSDLVRTYSSPPRRGTSWVADRPGDLDGRQPEGERLGTPGPDQGYALKLAESFRGKITLRAGEHESDAIAGGSAIAMKRSALFGRAPVVHDLRVGLGLWGFLDPNAPDDLVALRSEFFDEVHLVHHYELLRRIADSAPEAILRLGHDEILARHRQDWRSCLDLTV
jgi:hypothetical protein